MGRDKELREGSSFVVVRGEAALSPVLSSEFTTSSLSESDQPCLLPSDWFGRGVVVDVFPSGGQRTDQHAAGDQIHRGFVPGDNQQQDHRQQLVVAQPGFGQHFMPISPSRGAWR